MSDDKNQEDPSDIRIAKMMLIAFVILAVLELYGTYYLRLADG